MDKYYKILDLKPGSSNEEIKKAYKKLAVKYHPDKQNNASDEKKAEAEEKFKEIADAYDILINPEKLNNNKTFKKTNIDPNELFNHFFNININNHNNPFSDGLNININGINISPTSNNSVMRSSCISIVNGKKIQKITETINGVTTVKTIISDNPITNSHNIRIN
mgnify:CR=1 FL=1|tara:strand:- start:666 stop:1160 length:495 start_codon:yes stop_codon:yes gene_type:complete